MAAKKASAESGLPAGVTVAQAALESRWGESGLAQKAKNYFGIKAYGKHAWVDMPTTEVEDGAAKQVMAKFAAYESMEQCFTCRDQLISTSAYYVEAKLAANDPMMFIEKLAVHWATDPNYAEKLKKLYEDLRPQTSDVS